MRTYSLTFVVTDVVLTGLQFPGSSFLPFFVYRWMYSFPFQNNLGFPLDSITISEMTENDFARMSYNS